MGKIVEGKKNELIKKILHSKLFKDSFIYILSDVLNASIPIILLPVLTHYLSPTDYSNLSLINSFIAIVSVFIGTGIVNLIGVNYYKLSSTKFKLFIGNTLFIIGVATMISILFVFLFNTLIKNYVLLSTNWMLLAILIGLFNLLILITLVILTHERKPILFGSFQISISLIKIVFSLIFVVELLLNWKGRVWGIFIGAFVGALFSLFYLFKKFVIFKIKKIYIKSILKYYLPLIPHQLSGWLKTGLVLILISNLDKLATTAEYDIAMKLVLPISFIPVAFNKAWLPYFYKKLSDNPGLKEKIKIVKISYLYFITLFIITIIEITVVKFFVIRLLDKNYNGITLYLAILGGATFFGSLQPIFVNYIYFLKKTKYISLITVGGAILNVILTLILIKKNNGYGAAQAFLITSFLSSFAFMLMSYYYYPMPWNYILKKRDYDNK